MDWAIFFTILGGTIAVIGFVYQFLRNFKTDINDHLDKVDKNIDRINTRLDGHAMRIDQLYKMFVDLLREKK